MSVKIKGSFFFLDNTPYKCELHTFWLHKQTNQMQILPSILKHPKPQTLISFLKNHTFFYSNYHKFSLSLLQDHSEPSHFNQILSQAITSGHFSDPFVSSKLLNHSLSFRNNALPFSRALFFYIENPNVHSWNFMFRAFSQSPFPAEAINLYNQMLRTGGFPDKYSFPFVLKACGRLSFVEKGMEIHCLTVKLGLEFDVFVQNTLIYMYFQCEVVEFSWKVFSMMPYSVRDVVTWNSIISGYLQSGFSDKALNVFGEMLGNGDVRPNQVTVVSVITACARIGLLELGKKIHSLSLVAGFVMDVYLGSSLIDMYMKCGQADDAKKVFDRMPERNVVCWTSMIAGYVKLDSFKEAIELFREMQVLDVKADSATIACVVSACGHLGALDQGKWVHTYCERSGIEMNLTVYNALIDMYSKCGEIEKALEIFSELTYKDVFSWSSMISGLAMNGQSDKALRLLSEMERLDGVRPNEVTFLGILSACSHSGYVSEGINFLNIMTQQYNLIPRIEHYGCIVDLLGRANLLVDAEIFIRSLPINPDAVIWRSLLFACRSHGNVELGEFAAKKLQKLEPKSFGAQTLLSNVYASASRWNDAKNVRNVMKCMNGQVQKEPGCSFVEISGSVHEFLAADDSHHDTRDIYETVTLLNKDIRSEVFD